MTFKNIFLFTLLLVCLNVVFAQRTKLDSLTSDLKLVKSDTAKFNTLYQICFQYYKSSANNSEIYTQELVKVAYKIHDSKHLAKAYDMKGQLYSMLNKLDSAIISLDTAIKYANAGNLLSEKANILDSYGAVYEIKGDYGTALKMHLDAIKYHEKQNNKESIANSYKYIGRIFGIQEKFKQALYYFGKSLEIDRETNNRYGYGQSVNNIAICYLKLHQLDSSIYFFNQSIQTKLETNNKRGLVSSYSNIIDAYLEKGDVKKAMEFSGKLTSLAEELKSNLSIASAYEKAGEIYTQIKRPAIAKMNFIRALHNYEAAQKKESIMAMQKQIALSYKALGKIDSALYHYEYYNALKDSLFNENNTKSLSEMEAKYQNQKKENEISLLQKDKLLSDSELSKQKTFRNFLILVAALIFILGLVLYRSNQVKKVINAQLTHKNTEVEKQKQIIEEKQKGITDSINYALRIQEAILPSKESKRHIFNNAFILLKPKDIVSGDFYWFAEKNGKKLIAAVDCTGHGVPGAFMSMIGVAFLNEIVNEKGITTPNLILGELRDKVKASLKQQGLEGESKDGMDMAILSFDENYKSVEYAGANNPLWIFRKNEDEIQVVEIAPDKRPIGYFRGQGLPFTNHTIDLMKGDSLYIFTDGYADQFGGPKGKKFKYKQIKEVLKNIHHLEMHQQEIELSKTLGNWQGNLEQVDDICIIGISV